MTVSAAKLAANRANALRSTGPKTAEGKARVARNALRHGLTSKDLVVADADREEFEFLQAELLAEVAPETTVEALLFEQLLHAAWNLRRVRRLEAQLYDGVTDPLADDALQAKMNMLARHHTRHERSFHRALREIKALKTQRVAAAVLTDSTGREVSPLADAGKLAKQTQKLCVEEMWADLFELNRRREDAFVAQMNARADAKALSLETSAV
jgi:hypothetical protein